MKLIHNHIPFKSSAQRAFLYARHPEIAAKFERDTPKGKKLPKHVKGAKKSNKPRYPGEWLNKVKK